ncbi:MAG TPA: hypothetical protein VFC19_04265 [Candidatus Limnocylindrales bacterium]|nr:hypothetical protein [Candidatus Limnocylindrales bacterium]
MSPRHAPWGARTEPVSADDAKAWITGLIPDDLYASSPDITIDRDEILIVGKLGEPTLPADATDADRAAAESGRISAFRESTRDQRIKLARQAEHRYERKVAWGAECGGTKAMFTTHSVPVMTRLRQQERKVLDTLVDAGVARSRSEALAWCVKLVGQHSEEWLAQLRDALTAVDDLRRRGPA